MPFILNQTDEDLKKQAQANQIISGSSTIINGGNASANNPSTSAPKASGSFTNLQSYLDANKDQAAGMGQKIVDGVDNKADLAKTSIDNFSNNVGTVSSVSKSDLNTNFYDDPTRANKEAYTALKAGYSGPIDISKVVGYSDSIDAWSDASEGLKNASTESGRQQLLKDTYAKPGYTAGQNMLDQTLVQNNAESKNAFEGLQGKWRGLNGMLDSATAAVGSKIATNLSNDKSNKDLILQNETSVMDNFVSGLTNKAQEINNNKLSANQSVTAGLSSSQSLTPEQLSKLGITSEQWKNIQDSVKLVKGDTGVDKSSLKLYANNNLKPVTAQSIATAEEYERFAALNNLIDANSSFLSDSTLAGTDSAEYQAIDFKNLTSGILEPINSRINTLSRMIDTPAAFGNFNDFDRLAGSIVPGYLAAGLTGQQRKQILINALNESKSKAQQITNYFNK